MKNFTINQVKAARQVLKGHVDAGRLPKDALDRFDANERCVATADGQLLSFAQYAACHADFTREVVMMECLGEPPIGAIEARMFGCPVLAVLFVTVLDSDNALLAEQASNPVFEAGIFLLDPCRMVGSEGFTVADGILQPILSGPVYMASRSLNSETPPGNKPAFSRDKLMALFRCHHIDSGLSMGLF